MPSRTVRSSSAKALARALIEVAFIVFLFYSNLLMGEFESGSRAGKTLGAAFRDILTGKNLAIAIIAAVVGFAVFEALRKMLRD